MYDFSYFLQKPDTHDVMFKAADGSSAGFCKIVLLGLSEVWRTRDEHWPEQADSEGCVCHTVELDCDTSQDVLDALQTAVFTGKLPDCCSWQVLVQLARLADAELMPAVLQLVADALYAACMQNTIAMIQAAPDEATTVILSIDTAIGHIPHKQLETWMMSTARQLADPIANSVDLMTILLNELPANSMAALGVLRAAWPKMPRGYLPIYSSDRPYHDAIMRHKQVMLEHPSRDFLCEADFWTSAISDSPLLKTLQSICRTLLGPPSEAISTPEAFNTFWSKVMEPKPILRLWRLYISESLQTDLDCWRLVKRVHDRVCALNISTFRLQPPPAECITLLCGGSDRFVQLSADDLELLLLPVLQYANSDAAMIAAVEALVIVKRQGKGRRRKRGGGGRNRWNQY